ncbi:hypothetical protein E2I00_019860 [Balaenoptera physalus]|uniref:Casein kinase II subunit beta n=1 Tax=Balaenoptera physalus TaxID=9770 RepID=A0A643BX80_BALPH|nr:hypothetical protein E2I00_019860 [Balaenoptera physalus]
MLSNSLSDTPGEALVKLYCPKCMDVSTPKTPSRKHHTKAPTWVPVSVTMLFTVHTECRPKQPTNQFMSKVCSCKIHPLSYQMQFQAASNFESIKTVQ